MRFRFFSDPKTRAGEIARRSDGSVLIEFSLIILPFVTLITAILELGIIYWCNSMLDNALLQVSRRAQVGCVRNDCDPNQAIQNMEVLTPADFAELVRVKTLGMIDVDPNSRVRDSNGVDNPRFCLDIRYGADGSSSTSAVSSIFGGGSASLLAPMEFVSYHIEYRWPIMGPTTLIMQMFNLQDDFIYFSSTTMVRHEHYTFPQSLATGGASSIGSGRPSPSGC